jgi:hypothetical protein
MINGTERFSIPGVVHQQRTNSQACPFEIPAHVVRRSFGSFNGNEEFTNKSATGDPGIVLRSFYRAGVQLGAAMTAPAATGVISGQETGG